MMMIIIIKNEKIRVTLYIVNKMIVIDTSASLVYSLCLLRSMSELV